MLLLSREYHEGAVLKCKVAENINCLVLQRHQNLIKSIEMQSPTASRLNKSPEQ